MMQCWRVRLTVLVCCLGALAPALAQDSAGGSGKAESKTAIKDLKGDAAAGKERFYTCVGCHGIPDYNNAYPTYHVPKLGGQHKAYIISALKEYRGGKVRKHSTMHAQASSLSDQDIADIAAFLSQQKPD